MNLVLKIIRAKDDSSHNALNFSNAGEANASSAFFV